LTRSAVATACLSRRRVAIGNNRTKTGAAGIDESPL
jgi:hypothetical protein